jgi:phosphoglycolate phosphatase
MTAILFDLDGTLLNTLEDLTDATNAALEHFGCPPRTLEEVRQFVGNGAERLIRLALPGKADDPDVAEVLAWYKAYYAAHSQIKTCPYAGVLEAVEAVKKAFPVAIVSNKPDQAVKPLAAQYFPGLYARGESVDCPRKPAPDMVFKAMEALGVEKCIYVGDSEVDVLTAKNASVPCLSVLWGFRDQGDMIEAGGKCFCHDPADLVQILVKMENEYGK